MGEPPRQRPPTQPGATSQHPAPRRGHAHTTTVVNWCPPSVASARDKRTRSGTRPTSTAPSNVILHHATKNPFPLPPATPRQASARRSAAVAPHPRRPPSSPDARSPALPPSPHPPPSPSATTITTIPTTTPPSALQRHLPPTTPQLHLLPTTHLAPARPLPAAPRKASRRCHSGRSPQPTCK